MYKQELIAYKQDFQNLPAGFHNSIRRISLLISKIYKQDFDAYKQDFQNLSAGFHNSIRRISLHISKIYKQDFIADQIDFLAYKQGNLSDTQWKSVW